MQHNDSMERNATYDRAECSWCRAVKENGVWSGPHAEADPAIETHGICPTCLDKVRKRAVQRAILTGTIVSLFFGCEPTPKQPQHYEYGAAFYSLHAIPKSCPCTEDYTCRGNVCVNDSTGDVATINYVASPSVQGSFGCYDFAKYHAFQATVAKHVDQAGIKDWSSDDRSVRLALGPYYTCGYKDGMDSYVKDEGMIEWCFDPFDVYPFDDDCLWDRPKTYARTQCAGLQDGQAQVVKYRGLPVVTETPDHIESRKEYLAHLISTYGAVMIRISARYAFLDKAPKNVEGYENPGGFELYDVVCDTTRKHAGHFVALVGYDFRRERSVFFAQDSSIPERYLWRMDYYSWARDCEFGKYEAVHFVDIGVKSLRY